ncbi:radical SAM protein [Bradyrhizobium sp. HKCCYLS2058]|uniref:radical SAM protein n=1 Tax=Bradyrhizobium TaxID=374 RepID=UPI0029161033|nr:radical SAM protein [Bradyrhizobium sp. SZCCHNRI1009]
MKDGPHLHFVFKVASRCNLNCSYCYVYNKGDSTWKERPAIMDDEVVEIAIDRIRRHCLATGQTYLTITFHGGEPCLVKHERFSSWCQKIKDGLAGVARVQLCMQTNGTLLDDGWAEIIKRFDIDLGISIDGTPDVHDSLRVDHAGRGSYHDVEQGLSVLRRAGIPLRFLSVIQLGASGAAVHRHLTSLGPASIDYLLPDFTHDTIAAVRDRYGPTPCADFLIPIFEDWWRDGTLDLRIKIFWNIAWLVQGGESRIDMLGNQPLTFLFVNTDGEIEGLDVLRVCYDGAARTGLNVRTSDFMDVQHAGAFHRAAVFEGLPLPDGCRACRERDTCAGGYLPHRYASQTGFNNPTVWCADLLKLFDHVRERLGTSVEETKLRRAHFIDMALQRAVGLQQELPAIG